MMMIDLVAQHRHERPASATLVNDESSGYDGHPGSRESTPSPGADVRRPKRYEYWMFNWFVALATPLVLLLFGVGLEAAVIISSRQGGFRVPLKNSLPLFTPQFLLSFVPVLVILPTTLLWREIEWAVRWYQPYLVLYKGNATAEESILLDYLFMGPFFALTRAKHYKHRVLFWSAFTGCLTYAFQPLAGAIFQLQVRTLTNVVNVNSTKSLDLFPNVDQLAAFVAAAGFTDAAVYNDLPDPRFIDSSVGWAVQEFEFPNDAGLNGTVTTNRTAVLSSPNCNNPITHSAQVNPNNTITLSAQSVDGCNVTASIDPQISTSQYGVLNFPCPTNTADVDIALQPVVFWFFANKTDGTPATQAVFCTPSIQVSNVQVSMKLTDGTISELTQTGGNIQPNNVTGGTLNGKAFNGVVFPPNTNPYIQARGITAGTTVSGAIFRSASLTPGGPQSVFDLANGFLDITNNIYRLHLSLSAKSIYFVKDTNLIPAEATSMVPILLVDPLPGHLLALLLIFTGCAGIIVQIIHIRQRRKLIITAPPGTIAAVTALTARSGFGDLLLPYDNEATLERKLSGLRFGIDRRTGVIVADVGQTPGASSFGGGRDESTMSLLGNVGKGSYHVNTLGSLVSASSSRVAFETAAAGYPAKPV